MAKKIFRFGVHPAVAMVQKCIAELKEKTGRSLEEWQAFIKKNGPATEEARRAWLKGDLGLGTNYAGWIAARSVGKGEDETPEGYLKAAGQYVETMFSGKKEGLRPIYEALMELSYSIAKDVKACPCTTMVPIYRNHVIAQIKPTTNTRVDFGFALKDTKATRRLIDTGGFEKKDRISHRIGITSVKEIDAEVKKWLKKAYDMDG
ncbi:MAG: DUF4287 domain-containing protein [Gemmataceae bacterium]|nr:DUF4287 domain-containing protein [Gemmataceae bacterium]MCI0738552.1 DUF4287 domain-containing protein [Gemmataceae bacterium]